MDEVIELLRGMSAEEIRELIETSAHAGDVRDPEGLAAFLAEQAALP